MENFVDVSEAFDGLLQTVTLYRPGAGSYVGGKWMGGTATAPTVQAVVQNATPDDMLTVPEGLRSEEAIKLHSADPLRSVVEVGKTNADQVTYDGSKWLVQKVFNRRIGGYYKAVAIRIKANVS